MKEDQTSKIILQNAVTLFSKKGFHGVSMRELAAAAGCSLPSLYYYYQNKAELFYEITVRQFFKITDAMNKKIDLSAPPEELYWQVIQSRKELTGFERDVYKMALRVWLGFEDHPGAREKIMEWENKRLSANLGLMQNALGDSPQRQDIMEILINYMENMINKIILLDAPADEESVKRQLHLLFSCTEKTSKT